MNGFVPTEIRMSWMFRIGYGFCSVRMSFQSQERNAIDGAIDGGLPFLQYRLSSYHLRY